MGKLHDAAKAGDVEKVRSLLAQRVDVNARGWIDDRTPLQFSVQNGHINVAELLLEQGADPDSRESTFASPLAMAVHRKDQKMADLLLRSGAHPDGNSKNTNVTPLHTAFAGGIAGHCDWLDLIELLLKYGANVNARATSFMLMAPLHMAAENDWVDVINLLLDHGADIDQVAGVDQTPLGIAESNKHAASATALSARGAHSKICPVPPAALHDAVVQGDLLRLQELLDHGTDINAVDQSGFTPLAVALVNKRLDVAEFLLSHGASVDRTGPRGRSPLHLSAIDGRPSAVELLLRHGARKDIHDTNGWTPLHCAAHDGSVEVVKSLVNAGCRVTAVDHDGATALHHAAETGNSPIVECLLRQGTPIDVKDHAKRTPLHYAAAENRVETIELLLGEGGDPNAEDRQGRKPALPVPS